MVNSIVGGYLADSYFAEYQLLRHQLMEILSDDDLGLRLGGETASLGMLCREIGEIEYSYVESFETFRQRCRAPVPPLAGRQASDPVLRVRGDRRAEARIDRP